MALVFVGTIITVIGVFLPWLHATVSSALVSTGGTVTGYDLNQGLIGGGIAILSAILGFLGSVDFISNRIIGFLIIIASIVIVIVSGSLILDPGSGSIRVGSMSVQTNVSLQIGIFVTAVGGIILLIGGVVAFFRED